MILRGRVTGIESALTLDTHLTEELSSTALTITLDSGRTGTVSVFVDDGIEIPKYILGQTVTIEVR